MTTSIRHTPAWRPILILVFVAGLVGLSVAAGRADLRSPPWYDANGVGAAPDWHYRVPVAIPANAAVNSTVRLDVDFNALLAQMGNSGMFESNSPRVVRGNGVLAATQQFADRVYAGASDAAGNGRGEIRFLLQDPGPATYFLYFDAVANGPKPVWPAADTINGNFEFSNNNQQSPPGWSGQSWSTFNAFAIANDFNRTVTTDAGSPAFVVTDEVAHTGEFCYLIGARNSNEAQNRNPSTRLERTFSVPSTNPGRLQLRYRVKGWDSAANGSSQWDFISIQLRRGNSTVAHLVGPAAGNYTVSPFSPNLGTDPATTSRSGYGQYNGWDTDTNGVHRSGMTIAPGAEPWFSVDFDLGAYPNQSLTLRVETRNSTVYKSWFHIDDVEWSVVEAALGTPQPFGVDVVAPDAATVYRSGETLMIRARVDAAAAAVSAALYNPLGVLMAAGIPLFNDGTHGDTGAGDAFWANNGSDPAQATYHFLSTDMPGAGWYVVVTAADAHISVSDTQPFTLVTPPNIMLLKTVRVVDDPLHGTVNPKAIPGALMEYSITAHNQGGSATDADTVFVTDPIPAGSSFYVGDLGQPGGPVAFEDGSLPSGLSFDPAGDLRFSSDNGVSFNVDMDALSADAQGCDGSITHLRVNPKGGFAAASNGDVPRFTLRFRVRVR